MTPDELIVALQAENDGLAAVIRAMESSRSWRLTRPLRNLAAAWRRGTPRRAYRQAQRRSVLRRGSMVVGIPPVPEGDPCPSVCAIVHAYYLEILPEIVWALQRCGSLTNALVTFPAGGEREGYRRAVAPLVAAGVQVDLIAVENRGRDMLPLALVAQRALDTGAEVFIKVHTKRSPHLGEQGVIWRAELLNGLLPDLDSVEHTVRFVAAERSFGFGVPIASLGGKAHRGKNRAALSLLSRRAGLRVPRRLYFPAGGMYWCSRGWLEAVAALGLTAEDFEAELGQLDSTMAHALERLIGCYSATKKATIWVLGSPEGMPQPVAVDGLRVALPR